MMSMGCRECKSKKPDEKWFLYKNVISSVRYPFLIQMNIDEQYTVTYTCLMVLFGNVHLCNIFIEQGMNSNDFDFASNKIAKYYINNFNTSNFLHCFPLLLLCLVKI